jgi:methyltransferase (TIGR00027 family)
VIGGRPSLTARRVAESRAAHQLLDAAPRVLEDPLALRILGDAAVQSIRARRARFDSAPARFLRAFLVARSRIAEDTLGAAVARGVRQYVILGAGLDTFAYRSPYPPAELAVFEVDHPDTQRWKRALLERAGITQPSSLTWVPVDFERQTLAAALQQAGLQAAAPAFFSWLGVTMYLTRAAVRTTLDYVAARSPGSAIVFDYAVPPSALPPLRRAFYYSRLLRVAAAGEPWRCFFEPHELARELAALGFCHCSDLGAPELNQLLFAKRTDQLRVAGPARLLCARN